MNTDLYQVLFYKRFQIAFERRQKPIVEIFIHDYATFNQRLFFNGTDTQPSQLFYLVHWAVGVDEGRMLDPSYHRGQTFLFLFLLDDCLRCMWHLLRCYCIVAE